jgi:hypothetical protein
MGKILVLTFVAFGLFLLPACSKSPEQPEQPAKPKPKVVKPKPLPPPPTTQPVATKPIATKPAATKPAATKPAATKPATTQVAVAPPPEGYKPIPLTLPKPRFSGTPKQVPPGTRVKPPEKGPAKARPKFFAPEGAKNVALKKPVIASDMEPVIGTLDLITDGSKEAVEDAYVELGPEVQHVQIDLEAEYKIYAIVFWHEHKDARVYKDVIVQVADDKDFITNVRTLFTNDHDNSAGQGLGQEWEYFETNEGKLVDCKGVKARFVRLYSNGSTADDLNRYTEVEVYGLPAE